MERERKRGIDFDKSRTDFNAECFRVPEWRGDDDDDEKAVAKGITARDSKVQNEKSCESFRFVSQVAASFDFLSKARA